ncbi:MAG TPA: hypothetical protein VHL53_06530 [Acidimicrobiia bacterium]|nr:hypothetical protein [Acidimicrobiia bacterium]
MQIRSDRGWIRAGLGVLVTAVLGGGVLAVACGKDGPRQVKADGVATGPTPTTVLDLGGAPTGDDQEKPNPKVGDKVTMGSDGGSVTVVAVEDNVSAGRLFGAGKDLTDIGVQVKGCAGPNEKNITFEPAYFLLMLDDGTMHDPGPGAKKPELQGGTIPAGKCLDGWVTYTVAEGGLPTGVVYDGSTRTTWTVPIPKGAHPTTTTTLRPGATTSTTEVETTTSTTARSSKSSPAPTTTTTARKSSAKPETSTTTTTARTASTARAATTTTTAATTGKPAASTTTTTGPRSTTSTTQSGRSVVAPPGADGEGR